ncbi:tight adherence protein B [Micromonospora rhizosphaerae]|uniref:Tight adherence protein B n=1 Tax=Micromonospora rhizosphaerae TaxID=568872 RepID=A0A1C6RJK5_9ACTN|nr:tight adherence protein B [Micromonospora rhizosphaerae]
MSAHPDGLEGGRRWFAPIGAGSARRTLLLVALVGGGIGGALAGPVAAVVLGAYAALGVRAVLRRQAGRRADRARRQSLDQLCALAADLRAGLPVTAAVDGPLAGEPESRPVDGSHAGGPGSRPVDGSARARPVRQPCFSSAEGPGLTPSDGPARIRHLARAAVRLADDTGAPLAELLERIEADARAADRGLAAAAAQAAGARATAWLLAALPLGGIALGYAIGVDPVAVLVHTPIGGGSAVLAVALQIGGLLWAERLGASPGWAD